MSKISSIALYALIILSVVVLGLFYFGSSAQMGEHTYPFHTDTLIYWMYILLGIAIVITLGASLVQFALQFKHNAKEAVKTLVFLTLFVLVLVIAYVLGDPTPLTIKGYEGTGNSPFWLKITDMNLYTTYFLTVVAILCIVVGAVKKRFS